MQKNILGKTSRRTFVKSLIGFSALLASPVGFLRFASAEVTKPRSSSISSANPLLNLSRFPNGVPALNQIKPEHCVSTIKETYEKEVETYKAICNSANPPTFRNTIEPISAAKADAETVYLITEMFSYTAGDTYESAFTEVVERRATHLAHNFSDNQLYSRVKKVYDDRDALNLTEEEKSVTEKIYMLFVENGSHLSVERRAEIKSVQEKLSQAQHTYNENLSNRNTSFQLFIDNESKLAGISHVDKGRMKEAAIKSGAGNKWLLTDHDVKAVDRNCAVQETRKLVYDTQKQVQQKYQNQDVKTVLEIVKLRKEKAKLLGFENFADFVVEGTSLKTPEQILSHMTHNASPVRKASTDRFNKLQAYAARKDGIKFLKPWDVNYYAAKMKSEASKLQESDNFKITFDKNYLNRVHREYGQLLGIQIKDASEKYPTGNPDVQSYEIYDQKKDGKLLGVIYTSHHDGDDYSMHLRGRHIKDGKEQIPVSYCCNSIPKSEDGSALKISYDKALRNVHEFGHALNMVLIQGKYNQVTNLSLDETSNKNDLVEYCSQVMERHFKDNGVLDSMLRHEQTGDLPSSDILKEIKSQLRWTDPFKKSHQNFLAIADLHIHQQSPKTLGELQAIGKTTAQETGFLHTEN